MADTGRLMARTMYSVIFGGIPYLERLQLWSL
jgi:hypothetical protein